MKKQYTVQVRQYLPGSNEMKPLFDVVETIKRVPRIESIGNFCPMFVTYKGDKRCVVQSEMGDVSDPFRVTKEYAKTFFIELNDVYQPKI